MSRPGIVRGGRRALRWLAALGTAASLAVAPGCRTDKTADEETPRVRIDGQRFRVDLLDDDLALGGDTPLVTIVVFTDYACPPCGRTWQVMDNLVEDYGPDIRVVYRSYTVPGFPRGEQAAEAAYAAGAQGKFWQMHRRLFEHAGQFDRPTLAAHAEALGLDVERFLDDLDTGRHAGQRMRHRRQAKELGILGLPAMFVDGLFLAGFTDEKTWHAIVDEEIAQAKQMIASGVPRADLYAAHMDKAARGRVQVLPAEANKLGDALPDADAPSYPTDLRRPDGSKRYDVPTDGAPAIGPADAPVVIVEFVDFRCPFCRRAWSEELQALLAEHEEDVRLVVKQLPLEIHPEARGAAVAALAAARHDRFAPMHERLMAHEGELGRSHFGAWATELGIDEAKLLAELDDPKLAARVEADMRLAASLGVTGTPAFFVNGRFLDGFRPGALRTAVQAELARANEAIAAGTPRAEVARALLGPDAVDPAHFPNATGDAATPTPPPRTESPP